ncbi:MAG TPA: hypothetical protein VE669_06770, partial [Actinomycetota bacterium]|nr:hypothetical protein [Actinomycetota bacterium]
FVIFALLLERLVFEPLSRRVFRWRPEVGEVAEAELTGGTVEEAPLALSVAVAAGTKTSEEE